MSTFLRRPIGSVRVHAVAVLLALALGTALLPPAGAQDGEPSGPSIPTTRLAGDTRFGTAAAVSRAAFDRADTVYIAPGGDFAYALAGGPRAARDGAPILLVDGDRVPAETTAELDRLRPREIVVLGGPDVVPTSVAEGLATYGAVRRIAGADRVDTVARIAADGWPAGAETVYLATDRDFPDALAGGVAAAVGDAPVLLTDTTYLPAATRGALEALDPRSVALLGGTAAITDDVALQVGEATTASIGRLGGLTRIETALAVSTAVNDSGLDVATVFLATAGNFPDAMASAPAIAASAGALVLTNRDCLPNRVRDEIARLAPREVVVLGGTAAVADAAASLQPCDPLPPPPTFEVVPRAPEMALPATGGTGERPVASLIGDDGQETPFAEDELVVSGGDAAALQDWVAEVGGEVLQTIPGVAALPPSLLVRLPDPPTAFAQEDLDALGRDLQWVNGIATGHHQLTSAAALRTLATATDALARGITVGLNLVTAPDQLINGQVQESATTSFPADISSGDPFTWPQLSHGGIPGHGTAEAWRLLEANGRSAHRVQIAVLDGGFATTNGDYPSDVEGNTGEEARLRCGDDDCPWHGTDVSIAAAGVMDNGFGSVGTAGPLPVALRQYTVVGGVDSFLTQLHRAVEDGADVVNMSFSGQIGAVASVFDGPPHLATLHAHLHRDVVLVAAAGNQGLDVNRTDCFLGCWQRATHWPCEMDGVYCVGGLATGTRDRDPGSNYGREACDNPVCGVKIFAPYTVIVGENPDEDGDRLRAVPGTSGSAPYVAGVLALLRAANPGLRAYELVTLLNATAHPSPHPQVGRVVNAYGAVLSALGPDARILIGANRTPSPFPQDPVPAAAFASALGSDQATLQGDGVLPSATPRVAWATDLPDTDHPALGWDASLVADDVLILPIRDRSVPSRGGDDISLIGIDLRSGERRWQVDHLHRGCKPVVDRDGTLWAVRGTDVTATLDWTFAVVSINPATGRVTNRFTTPRDLDGRYPAETDPLRDCGGFPLRLSPDGTRLLVWQGTFYTGYSSLRLLDITAPDVIETVLLRMDHTVDDGAVSRDNLDAGWVRDIRVNAERHTAYVLERDGGADPTDLGYDDGWVLHAIDLAGLPRRGSLTDPGISSRSAQVPVAGVDVARWMVLGDDVIIAGGEERAGTQRLPSDGEGVIGRTFRIVDDGVRLTTAAYRAARATGDAAGGDHAGYPRTLSAGDGQTLVALGSANGLLGIDRETLAQRWRVDRGSWTDDRYQLLVDDRGDAVLPGPFGAAMASVTPAGATRWGMVLRGDGSRHPYVGSSTTLDFDRYSRYRLIAVTDAGRLVLQGFGNDGSGWIVIALQ